MTNERFCNKETSDIHVVQTCIALSFRVCRSHSYNYVDVGVVNREECGVEVISSDLEGGGGSKSGVSELTTP